MGRMTRPFYCPACGTAGDGVLILHYVANIYECTCVQCGSQCVILTDDSIINQEDLPQCETSREL